MVARRLLELLALTMIGEGVVGAIKPREYLLLWKVGPRPLRDFVQRCADRPELMRGVFTAQISLGAWLALRQLKGIDKPKMSWSQPWKRMTAAVK